MMRTATAAAASFLLSASTPAAFTYAPTIALGGRRLAAAAHRPGRSEIVSAAAAASGGGAADDLFADAKHAAATALLALSLTVSSLTHLPPVAAADAGAETAANAKITTGGASTLQSGRTIAITRGVNLDRSDFSRQNLKGVAFQQSIVRDSDFRGSNLVGSSFFDATVDGSDFEGADLTLANFEMAQFNRASLKNAVAREMYVSGATIFAGIKDIEGSDWTDTQLRRDQQKYLCGHPTARGTNPTTGVDTRESLMCPD